MSLRARWCPRASCEADGDRALAGAVRFGHGRGDGRFGDGVHCRLDEAEEVEADQAEVVAYTHAVVRDIHGLLWEAVDDG